MKKKKIEDLHRVGVGDYKVLQKHPVMLVLDNVRSMNNVGSAFRTADAMLVEKLWLCGITRQPPHRDIQKTALGATESVDWEYRKETSELIPYLKGLGYKLIAVEQVNNSMPLHQFYPNRDEKIALFFGHEVNGVQEEIVNACDLSLEIPQFGTKHSLNITVSIGIVLWHYVRQMLI